MSEQELKEELAKISTRCICPGFRMAGCPYHLAAEPIISKYLDAIFNQSK